ncbi:hypothetical protein [Herbidospora daliensis]|uniref:hypothetical protein n=1 Tax=Herbidospora daliensis TaxID=295585 RepID=UPI000A93A77B|nr:hypothetical protein [Herbidospora daliensis]
MTTPVKCEACDGRGWKIVTRRGQATARLLGLETSAPEDCLFCDGPLQMSEMYEWEVFHSIGGTDRIGPCGTTSQQASSMDELRAALRQTPADVSVWGRIKRRAYRFGFVQDDRDCEVLFHATLDGAGQVRFERTGG